MIRPHWFSAAALVVAVASPASSDAHSASHAHSAVHAHETAHAFAFGDGGDFHWAVVSKHGQESMSGQVDPDLLEDLRDRYDEPFLVIGDGDDRYVITDEELIERAQRAAREIRKYGKEIGEYARAQARLSLSDARLDKRQARLQKKQKSLERSIRDAERRGESTEELEQELFRIETALRALEGVERSFALTSEEKEDLTERRDVAKKQLKRGVDRVEREMRELLETAKSRGLAEPVH